MKLRSYYFHIFFFIYPFFLQSQSINTSNGKKSLKNYDLKFYHLQLSFDLENGFIKGSNEIFFKSQSNINQIMIDLSEKMVVDSIMMEFRQLNFTRKANQIIVNFGEKIKSNENRKVKIYYSGKPIRSLNPPWDGGMIYSKDKLGNFWLGMACEGIGASCWFPCKDDLSDKVDSALCTFEVPIGYTCISNGVLTNKKPRFNTNYEVFEWKVNYPIANYNLTFNIGKYTHFADKLTRTNGDSLSLDYYVMPYHLDKARSHFAQTQTILNSLEKYFGKYPFEKDGYAMVETPYLGMEHQGAISYGNQFKNDYLNDFIILHETAHEWWGNNVAVDDMADMWIQEGFATYSEWLFYEDNYGADTMIKYAQKQRGYIQHKKPVLGKRDSQDRTLDNTDIYYKGAWIIHTLRSWINNDELWKKSLLEIQKKFGKRCINTDTIIHFYENFFQLSIRNEMMYYLTELGVPKMSFSIIKINSKQSKLVYSWHTNKNLDFNIPIRLKIGGKEHLLRTQKGKGWCYIDNELIEHIEWPKAYYLADFDMRNRN